MPTTTLNGAAEITELSLFEETNGDVLEAFLIAKARNINIPPNWYQRTRDARRNRHDGVVAALTAGDWSGIDTLRDWNDSYRRECFYYGLKVLLDLDRSGKSEW